MTKPIIRSLVLIFWAGLLFQAAFMFYYKVEPYPTFRFPGFGGKVQTGSIKNFDQYEIYLHTGQEQDSVMYSLDYFLPDISYKKPTFDLIAAKYNDSEVYISEKKDFEKWLSDNISKNVPGKNVHKVSVLEVQRSYDLESNELKNDKTLLNYFNIELNSNE